MELFCYFGESCKELMCSSINKLARFVVFWLWNNDVVKVVTWEPYPGVSYVRAAGPGSEHHLWGVFVSGLWPLLQQLKHPSPVLAAPTTSIFLSHDHSEGSWHGEYAPFFWWVSNIATKGQDFTIIYWCVEQQLLLHVDVKFVAKFVTI